MKFLFYLLLGYVVFDLPTDDLRALLNFCNRSGVRIRKIRQENDKSKVYFLLSDEKKVRDFLQREQIEVSPLRRFGVPIVWRRYRHRVGMLAGLVLFFAAIYIAPLFIWEINIDGLDKLSREYVCELLAKEGVQIGAFSPAIDRKQVYLNMLRSTDEISWISVNLRGSSANVEIIERDAPPVSETCADAANLVASKSGQIVGADIVRGKLAVQNGKTVKAGDLLVSGVVDSQMMGTRYVYAEGAVLAAVSDDYAIEIPLECAERHYVGEKTLEATLCLFGKSINIFKNYSISYENYDTINRENNLAFLGLDRLPLSICTTVALPYEETPVTLDEDEALRRARAELKSRIAAKDTYAEILAREESYAVKDGVLVYRCRVEAIENIAAVAEFNVR